MNKIKYLKFLFFLIIFFHLKLKIFDLPIIIDRFAFKFQIIIVSNYYY
jgi:hypothetical protein